MGKAVVDDLLGQFPVRRTRTLNQSDGLSQNRALTAQDALDTFLTRKLGAASAGDALNQLSWRLRRRASGANAQRALSRIR